MIGDALSAELLKLSRNRWTAFWAFCFPPIAGLAFGVLTTLMTRSAAEDLPALPAAPLSDVMNGLGLSGNVIANLFLIAGAASLFAGEYRWETWRAILPRTERHAILVGKMLTFAIAMSLSLFAAGLAGLVVGLFEAAVGGVAPTWPESGLGAALALGAAFAISLMQALWISALVAALAVATRSLLAATMGTFIVLVGFGFLATALLSMGEPKVEMVAMPNVASGFLREWAGAALNGAASADGGQFVIASAIVLPLSAVLIFAAALAMFQRQDLARE